MQGLTSEQEPGAELRVREEKASEGFKHRGWAPVVDDKVTEKDWLGDLERETQGIPGILGALAWCPRRRSSFPVSAPELRFPCVP